MYPEFAFPDLVGELEHYVTTARKGYEHGRLDAATHLAEASVAILEEITGRLDEMAQAMRIKFDELSDELRKRILFLEDGDEGCARKWFETNDLMFHGETPAQALATREGVAILRDATCNYRVFPYAGAYQAEHAAQS